MTPDEAVATLASLTYKPGWVLSAYPVPDAVVFRAGTREPNIDEFFRTGRVVLVDIVLTETIQNDRLADFQDSSQLLDWAFQVVSRRELHEVEEWLRLGGRPLRAPHPGRGVPGILGDGTSTPT